jgi:HAD superfamily hydrolase (TIGR01509 family)
MAAGGSAAEGSTADGWTAGGSADASADASADGGSVGQTADAASEPTVKAAQPGGGPDAVIFDLDGVLIDSEQVWDEIRRRLVAERGGRWLADSTRAMLGMSTPEWAGYLVGLGVGMTADEAAGEVLRRLAERYGDAPPLIDGAVEAVRALAARLPLAVASSSPRAIIERVLVAAGLAGDFRTFVSSEEVGRGKPAPDVYQEAARRLGVQATRCVAVEDSTNGVRSAAAAGMAVVVVPNPHFPPSAEALALASARIERIGDLTLATVHAAYAQLRGDDAAPLRSSPPTAG